LADGIYHYWYIIFTLFSKVWINIIDDNTREEIIEVAETDTGPSNEAYKEQRSELISMLPGSLRNMKLYD
jgi:hypothetical protein